MSAYYNELDPYPAAWLVRLADAGHIAAGRVDARSIAEVQAADLDGATQAHFFAGIGAWSYALRLAGWDDARPVWTGSCPCQPFSAAGKRRGFEDERHLWPEWFRLIRKCRPPVVFGEQVARGGGLEWFDLVSADLEAEGYAVGAANLAAPCAGAFHIRERLFFVAIADEGRRRKGGIAGVGRQVGGGREGAGHAEEAQDAGSHGAVADDSRNGRRQGSQDGARGDRGGDAWEGGGPQLGGGAGGVGVTNDARLEGHGRPVHVDGAEGWQVAPRHGASAGIANPWRDAEWLPCLDGKARPVEPGTFPLVDGAPARVGRDSAGNETVVTSSRVGMLRAYGNAIVPQVAAVFICAAMEVLRASDA